MVRGSNSRGRPRKVPPPQAEIDAQEAQREERHDRINDAIRRAGYPNKAAFLAEFDLDYSTLYRWEQRGDPDHGPRSPGARAINAAFLADCLKIGPEYLLPGGPKIYERVA